MADRRPRHERASRQAALRFASELCSYRRPAAGMDPQAAVLRRGGRPRLRRGVPARGRGAGRLPGDAPPRQFSRARAARLDPGRKLRGGRTTDPVSGYPPGTPDALARPSRTGTAHNLAAVPVFVGLPAAALTCGWRSWRTGQYRFGLYSAGSGVTMLAAMALAGAGFGQSPRLVSLGGRFQRTSIVSGFAWVTVLSARALRRVPAVPRRGRGLLAPAPRLRV
jgi:Protein of unknown function (DUF998)